MDKQCVTDLINAEETEEDLTELSIETISQSVVTSTDWTVETIVGQIKKGNINLDPKYQRRNAWDEKKKSRFIESLFLGLPIPEIVLATTKNRRGSFLVIDGKQRLLSLMQFDGLIEGREHLKLTGLEIYGDLNNKTVEDIRDDILLGPHLDFYYNQPIRTVLVKNWPSDNFLYLLFLRLNTGTVQLSPQELRRALHPGGFVDFVDEYTIQHDTFKRVLNLEDAPDFRMRDMELMIRYYGFTNFIQDYAGNLKSFLDSVCREMNDLWLRGSAQITNQVEGLERSIETTYEIFGKDAFRKFKEGKFENRFNRAVYDIMIFYFNEKRVSEKAIKQKARIKKEFQNLCTNNPEFINSLETTTKSIRSTYTRLNLWGRLLSRSINLPLPMLSLLDGRIEIETP